MQSYRSIIAMNIVALLILCVFVVHFAGSHGGASQATAGNMAPEVVTAKDAVAKDTANSATTGSAVAAAADDPENGRAIPGSPDRILDFAGVMVTVTPLIPDFLPEDYARNLVAAHRDGNPENGECYDPTTGQLWAVSITTAVVYEIERLYLDAPHGRLYMKAIKRPGEAARWGHVPLSEGFTNDMEEARRLELTTGDGVRRIFVLAGSS
jgi:hypothetical protein